MVRIAIIGAGLAGLTAAHALRSHADVMVFDKARGVGGRMATRRAQQYAFDHGAQYFTARTEPFRRFLAPLIDAGLIARWEANYTRFEGSTLVDRQNWSADESRYVATPGMNALAKHLAADFAVKSNTHIGEIRQATTWQLLDQHGQIWGDFDWIISAIPAPQAMNLLPCDFAYLDSVKEIDMLPCFAVMLGFANPFSVPFQAAHFGKSKLSWMAVNNSKPGRNDARALVLHSSHDYAKSHLKDEPSAIGADLVTEFQRITGLFLPESDHCSVHRWLYANNKERRDLPLLLDTEQQVGVCGDWTLGGRVEGAFMSAHRLSHALLETLG